MRLLIFLYAICYSHLSMSLDYNDKESLHHLEFQDFLADFQIQAKVVSATESFKYLEGYFYSDEVNLYLPESNLGASLNVAGFNFGAMKFPVQNIKNKYYASLEQPELTFPLWMSIDIVEDDFWQQFFIKEVNLLNTNLENLNLRIVYAQALTNESITWDVSLRALPYRGNKNFIPRKISDGERFGFGFMADYYFGTNYLSPGYSAKRYDISSDKVILFYLKGFPEELILPAKEAVLSWNQTFHEDKIFVSILQDGTDEEDINLIHYKGMGQDSAAGKARSFALSISGEIYKSVIDINSWDFVQWTQYGGKSSLKDLKNFYFNVILHEVGHALGLKHNFKASTQIEENGSPSSVMEYTPLYRTRKLSVGRYDKDAIKYLYYGEEPDTLYQFCEDAGSLDWQCNIFDHGANPSEYLSQEIRTIKSNLASMTLLTPYDLDLLKGQVSKVNLLVWRLKSLEIPTDLQSFVFDVIVRDWQEIWENEYLDLSDIVIEQQECFRSTSIENWFTSCI